MVEENNLAELTIGKRAILNYSRMSYTMWHALAEFIDNSTQSRTNYGNIIDDILKQEGNPLIVEISYNNVTKQLTVEDNSIGMSKETLVNALHIAQPTEDSIGRSRYGMGMKTAACWIGKKWRIETCEWGSGEEWSVDIDVNEAALTDKKIPLKRKEVSKDAHYTKIIITDLNRYIQQRTDETIRNFLGSIYRSDLTDGRVKIIFRGEEIPTPESYNFDTDPDGKPMKREFTALKIGNKTINGWVGVLKKGGRKFGGFSLFQNKRQIQGFPNAWRPKNIYGGVDAEGANNLVSQRLIGVIELDENFLVSHTKDAILFEGDEEEKLEDFLFKFTSEYREYATKRRGPRGSPWSRDKIQDLVSGLQNEFVSPEFQDALNTSVLPPLETIISNNQHQVEALAPGDTLTTFNVTPNLRIVVSLKETSEYEPYVTLAAGADKGTMHVIINRLHPYYSSLETPFEVEECLKQYIYDAIAEYQVSQTLSKLHPDSVRRLKDNLLRATFLKIENAAGALQNGSINIEVPASGTTG